MKGGEMNEFTGYCEQEQSIRLFKKIKLGLKNKFICQSCGWSKNDKLETKRNTKV